MVIAATVLFLILERVFPGRELPNAKGWYVRALLINLAQLLIILATARLWIHIFGGVSLFRFSAWNMPLAESLAGWFIGTFFFYLGLKGARLDIRSRTYKSRNLKSERF